MNPKIKDYVGIATIAALLIFIVAGVQFAAAYSRSAPAAASFGASGTGRVIAVPDTAEFTFGITTEGGTDVVALQKQNTDKTNAAIAYIKSMGVDAKDIATENYSIDPRYGSVYCTYTEPAVLSSAAGVSIRPCTSSKITGYAINQAVRVKVHNDFSKIGDLLSGVTSKGANNVSGLSFTVHDRTAIENDARAKAIAEAESKAQSMAKAGHFRLGRILSIQESGSNPPVYYAKAYDVANQSAGAAAPAPAIEPGSQEIVSNVTLTYEIN
jgi:uncharacterized protein YggE